MLTLQELQVPPRFTVYSVINKYVQFSFFNTSINIVCISRPIRRTVIFSLEILEKNNDECILILVIYWKKTGL